MSKGIESKICLAEEHLSFEFGKKYTLVVATFHFKNNTSATVNQLAGFPDTAIDSKPRKEFYSPDGIPVMGPLENMKTFIDGKEIESKIKYGYVTVTPDGYWVPANPKKGSQIAWHLINLSIPPNGETVVERRYKAWNGAFMHHANYFLYILHTGATWNGKIGKLTADLKLRDGLTVRDLYWPCFPEEEKKRITMLPGKDEWTILDNTHLRLIWSNFKPKTLKSRQQIQIGERHFDLYRQSNKWTITKSDHFAICDGYEIIYNIDEQSHMLYTTEISSGVVKKVTGGNHLSDYLKPGDFIEYEGRALDPFTVRIEDPNKDIFKVQKKK